MSDELTKHIEDLRQSLKIQAATPPDRTPWCRSDIMRYLQISDASLRDLERSSDFPKPRIRLFANKTGDRWVAKDVQDWFVNQQFQPGKPRAASTLFRKARDAAGVSDLHFHDARHDAITRLARKLDVLQLAHGRVSGS